uniref:Agrin n=1 Tax=Aceria tosichella TaxID=561515 RepID=A0A6G1SJH0_9ACAR
MKQFIFLLLGAVLLATVASARRKPTTTSSSDDEDSPCRWVKCLYGATCVPSGTKISCECKQDCSEDVTEEEYVCGQDGVNYKSKCHLEKHNCEKRHTVVIESYGKCPTHEYKD